MEPALLLFLFYVNVPGMRPQSLLGPPTFDDTGSLGSPRQVVYSPGSMVPPWVTASRFLAKNREDELKPTTFSSLLLFCVFLSFLFFWPPSDSTLECCLMGLLLNNTNNNLSFPNVA